MRLQLLLINQCYVCYTHNILPPKFHEHTSFKNTANYAGYRKIANDSTEHVYVMLT